MFINVVLCFVHIVCLLVAYRRVICNKSKLRKRAKRTLVEIDAATDQALQFKAFKWHAAESVTPPHLPFTTKAPKKDNLYFEHPEVIDDKTMLDAVQGLGNELILIRFMYASSIGGPMKGPHALSRMSLYSTTASISLRPRERKVLQAQTAFVASVSTDLKSQGEAPAMKTHLAKGQGCSVQMKLRGKYT